MREPNLLFILTDQQRADSMACYGNTHVDTPHLNGLADESFVFENTYVSHRCAALPAPPCSLGQFLNAEAERWQLQAQAQQITLCLQVPPELPTLTLDPARMSQAVGNLVQNAFQHTEAGDRITVTTTEQRGARVGISVSDDGAGIDVADLPHIFSRFYRTDHSRDRRTGGSGLGLAIAQAIVESHGGRIEATSPGVGRGSTFSIYLPVNGAAEKGWSRAED
jgi:signal transduction histidine kinase